MGMNTLELPRSRGEDQIKPQKSPDTTTIFSGLTAGLSDVRKNAETIIEEHKAVPFALKLKTTVFSGPASNPETEGHADENNEGGLEGTG